MIGGALSLGGERAGLWAGKLLMKTKSYCGRGIGVTLGWVCVWVYVVWFLFFYFFWVLLLVMVMVIVVIIGMMMMIMMV